MNFILIAVIVLGAIALIAAIVLFAASKKFAVYVHVLRRWASCCPEPIAVDADSQVVAVWPTHL